MQTSYFANLKNVTNPLSISFRAPVWYKGPEYQTFAPRYEFLTSYKNGVIDKDEYTVEFKRLVLDELNAKDVWDEIVTRYGEDVTLLCYEKPGEFCHRRLVADWFELELGVVVSELQKTTTSFDGI